MAASALGVFSGTAVFMNKHERLSTRDIVGAFVPLGLLLSAELTIIHGSAPAALAPAFYAAAFICAAALVAAGWRRAATLFAVSAVLKVLTANVVIFIYERLVQ